MTPREETFGKRYMFDTKILMKYCYRYISSLTIDRPEYISLRIFVWLFSTSKVSKMIIRQFNILEFKREAGEQGVSQVAADDVLQSTSIW